MSEHRQKRLLRILELISTQPIATQEDLAAALKAEGWDVTQSSVSRDIAALGLIKAKGIYRKPARVAREAENPDVERIREGVLMVDNAGDHLVVIHTPPGEANRVAVALDRLSWDEIVGTIAGDDTIFIAVRTSLAGKKLVERIREL